MNYDIHKPWLTLDSWQKEYIECQENCFLLCGRQSGKTAAASIKFGKIAATQSKRCILMIAYTEKQAYNLFFKTLTYLRAKYLKMIKTGNDKPTKHEIRLKNGSIIMCYAAGLTGEGIRTYTVTHLVIDEAAPMAREVFIAVMPMLSVTNGTMDIISTPRGKAGFFYECSKREDFKKFYVSAEDCPRHTKEFLQSQKDTMSTLEYAQEYLAQFLDDLRRVFSDDWIKRVCVLTEKPKTIDPECNHYLGVDIARMGGDEGTYEIIKKTNKDKYHHVESIITKKKLTTETEQKIIELNKMYDFKEIGIDAGSGTLGVSIFDHLLEVDDVRGKIVAMNNRARSLDMNDESKTKIFKEDMYNNLVALGERGELKLLDEDEVKASLASVQYEYLKRFEQPTILRIFSNYGHIVEGIIRAVWSASKDKHLKLWLEYR